MFCDKDQKINQNVIAADKSVRNNERKTEVI